jgi:hypothetical protein
VSRCPTIKRAFYRYFADSVVQRPDKTEDTFPISSAAQYVPRIVNAGHSLLNYHQDIAPQDANLFVITTSHVIYQLNLGNAISSMTLPLPVSTDGVSHELSVLVLLLQFPGTSYIHDEILVRASRCHDPPGSPPLIYAP